MGVSRFLSFVAERWCMAGAGFLLRAVKPEPKVNAAKPDRLCHAHLQSGILYPKDTRSSSSPAAIGGRPLTFLRTGTNKSGK